MFKVFVSMARMGRHTLGRGVREKRGFGGEKLERLEKDPVQDCRVFRFFRG